MVYVRLDGVGKRGAHRGGDAGPTSCYLGNPGAPCGFQVPSPC
jgi:hypothetical protein